MSTGERRRVLEAIAAAKTGQHFGLRDAFAPLLTAVDAKLSEEFTSFKYSPVFARLLRRYVRMRELVTAKGVEGWEVRKLPLRKSQPG
jgi:hypothetical protein